MKRLVSALMTVCLLAVSPVGLIHANPAAVNVEWDEASYVGTVSGKAHFYRGGALKQIVLVQEKNQTVLYTAKMGVILTPHVYPVPGQPERYLVWFEEQQGNTLTDHVMVVNQNGTHVEVANLPQQGYGSYTLSWSLDGKKAFYLVENAQNREGTLGLITPDKPVFVPLFGMIRARATDAQSVVGMVNKWHADWISNDSLLLLDGRKGNFYTVDTVNKTWKALFAKSYLKVKKMKVLPGLTDYALLEVGNPHYDVGFMGTERAYLINWKTNKLVQAPRATYGMIQQYDQQYLGLTGAKLPVFSEVVKVGTQYALAVFSYNPEREIKQNLLVTAPQKEYYVPQSFRLSPDGRYVAASMLNGDTKAYSIWVAQTSNGAVLLERKTTDLRQLSWKDNQTLLLGTEAVVIKK